MIGITTVLCLSGCANSKANQPTVEKHGTVYEAKSYQVGDMVFDAATTVRIYINKGLTRGQLVTISSLGGGFTRRYEGCSVTKFGSKLKLKPTEERLVELYKQRDNQGAKKNVKQYSYTTEQKDAKPFTIPVAKKFVLNLSGNADWKFVEKSNDTTFSTINARQAALETDNVSRSKQ